MLLQVKYILACSELSHTNSMLEKHISKKIGANKITEIATTQKLAAVVYILYEAVFLHYYANLKYVTFSNIILFSNIIP